MDKVLCTQLKEARKAKDLTQSEVCEKIGIPKVQTLSAYERGVNPIPLEVLKKLAKLYGVTTDWLIFGVKETQNTPKTPFDFLKQIVEGVASLGLILGRDEPIQTADYGWINGEPYIGLRSTDYPCIEDFAHKWYELQTLYMNGTLDKEDYETLLNKRLSSIEACLKADVTE